MGIPASFANVDHTTEAVALRPAGLNKISANCNVQEMVLHDHAPIVEKIARQWRRLAGISGALWREHTVRDNQPNSEIERKVRSSGSQVMYRVRQ